MTSPQMLATLLFCSQQVDSREAGPQTSCNTATPCSPIQVDGYIPQHWLQDYQQWPDCCEHKPPGSRLEATAQRRMGYTWSCSWEGCVSFELTCADDLLSKKTTGAGFYPQIEIQLEIQLLVPGLRELIQLKYLKVSNTTVHDCYVDLHNIDVF